MCIYHYTSFLPQWPQQYNPHFKTFVSPAVAVLDFSQPLMNAIYLNKITVWIWNTLFFTGEIQSTFGMGRPCRVKALESLKLNQPLSYPLSSWEVTVWEAWQNQAELSLQWDCLLGFQAVKLWKKCVSFTRNRAFLAPPRTKQLLPQQKHKGKWKTPRERENYTNQSHSLKFRQIKQPLASSANSIWSGQEDKWKRLMLMAAQSAEIW